MQNFNSYRRLILKEDAPAMAGHLANDETIWEDPPASMIQFMDSKNRERAVSADWFSGEKLERLKKEAVVRHGRELSWVGMAELALRLEYEDQQEELMSEEPAAEPEPTLEVQEEDYQSLLSILTRQAVKEQKKAEESIQDWF